MNQRRNGWILASSVLILVLFAVLWKAAAPMRARRQFEAQATAQLASTTMSNGARFDSIHVNSFRYNPKSDAYDVQYQLNYGDPNSPSSTWSSCSVSRHSASQCFATFSTTSVSFDISPSP